MFFGPNTFDWIPHYDRAQMIDDGRMDRGFFIVSVFGGITEMLKRWATRCEYILDSSPGSYTGCPTSN